MNFRRRRKLGRAMIAVLATAAAGLGAAPPAHAAADNEHIDVRFIGAGGAPGRFAAAGPIHGFGTAVDSDFHPGVGNAFTAKTTLIFSDGAAVFAVTGTHSDSFDPKTCIGSFSDQGQFSISRAEGALTGTTGSGRFASHGKFFVPRTAQGCARGGGTEVTMRKMDGTVHTPQIRSEA